MVAHKYSELSATLKGICDDGLLSEGVETVECQNCGEPFRRPVAVAEDRLCVDCMMTESDRRHEWAERNEEGR